MCSTARVPGILIRLCGTTSFVCCRECGGRRLSHFHFCLQACSPYFDRWTEPPTNYRVNHLVVYIYIWICKKLGHIPHRIHRSCRAYGCHCCSWFQEAGDNLTEAVNALGMAVCTSSLAPSAGKARWYGKNAWGCQRQRYLEYMIIHGMYVRYISIEYIWYI